MVRLHDAIFGWFQRILENWLLGLAARLVFAATLFVYFYNSFLTKVEPGLAGALTVRDSAYGQILGAPAFAALGADAAQVPMWPWGALVHLGTYAEIVLPVLIVLGFMTRIAAFGMLCFVVVQSYVDITGQLVPPGLVTGQTAPVAPAAPVAPVAGADPATDGAAAVAAAPVPGADPATVGAWFDGDPGSLILDQRAFWVFLLLYLVLRGAGAISLDRLFGGRRQDDYEEEY